MIPLTGSGAAPIPAFTPSSIVFASQATETASLAQTITLSNNGAADLNINAVTASGDFQVAQGSCGFVLFSGASCTFTVTFTPTLVGQRTGVLEVDTNGGPVTAALSGTGTPPILNLSSQALTFAPQPLNTVSDPQAVTIANISGQPLALTSISTLNNFQAVSNCPAMLDINASCSISVVYAPTSLDPQSGFLAINTILGTVTATLSVFHRTIHVPGDAASIMEGVNLAQDGDTVLVAPGTYFEQVNFEGKAITIAGAGGAANTVLMGNGFSPAFVTFFQEGPRSVLKGFTITNPSGPGVSIFNSSPTLQDNIITNNIGCNAGVQLQNSSAVLRHNVISNNTAASFCSSGGGISILGSGQNGLLQILGNTIAGNQTAEFSQSGGAGISVQFSGNVIITGNTIQNNSTLGNGGGIWVDNGSSADIVQNLITGNSAVTGGGIYYNAAFSQSSLLNNTVAGNFALSAGALFVDGGDSGLSIMDNLLIDPTGVGAVACGISGGQTPNFFFNDVFSAGQPKLAYTMGCQDQTGFNGNIKQDPQLVDGNSDFHLTAGSPAIDAGNPLLGLPFGQQAPALDLDGKGRIGPGDTSTCAGIIDMGVYEFALNATGNVLPLPSSWDFGSAFVGSSGAVFNFPIIAQGCVQLASVQTTGDFQQTNNCGAAVSSSCSIQVTFAPANSGLRTGTLTVDFGSTSPAQTVALTGQGSGASYQAAPSSFFFGDQQTQTSSSAQLVSLFPFNFNSQLLINAIWISGDFSQMNNCAVPPSPPTGVACTLNVVFTPTAVGPRTGSIIISSNQGTLTIPLSGNGVTTAIPVLSTNDLVFPDQGVQTSSAAQVVTLINKGNGTLQIQGFGISGDFSVTPSAACATAQNLDPGQSCTYSIVFTPQVAGIRVGSFSLQTNGGSVGVTLTGSGVIGVASVSPLSLSFAAQVVQTASSAQTITLSSTGGLPVTVTSIAASGDFSQTNNCGTSLAPGTACSISVIFTPSATGNRSGSLAIATNAGAFSASLSGPGATTQAQVAPQSLAFGSELANMPSRAQTVTLTAGVNSLQISSIIASGDFTQTSNCGAALAPASSCSIQVTFTPTVTAPRNGALTVSSNEGSLTAPLSGVGITHAANTIYVPADQSTIQAAINAAVDGQSVLVLPGTYPERIDFHGKAITVASTDGPGLTTIDGGLAGTVVNFTTGEGNASLLKGFTITHGTSTFEGAGIFISSASPTIDGNVITGNQGCQGIGIGIAFSTPIIRNNTISNNVQKTCSGGQGGGISVRGTGAPQILNNLITDNHLDNGGDGGGIALNGAAAIISGNTISGNTAFNNGGGIGLFNDSPATITQNLVIGNATRSGDGGGMYWAFPAGAAGLSW